MEIEIAAVGELDSRSARDLADDYLGRLGRYLSVRETEVDAGSASEAGERCRQEAERLAGAARDGVWIAVDRRGKSVTSRSLADWVEDQMVAGRKYVTFFIGGAYGLDASLRKECDWSLSLSSMTLPHELARVVLAEQLYRALTIVRNEPYHK